MESPNFNNQKHENTPKDAGGKELSISEQKEITTREKITLEIEGQVIEGEKYYFEYPKHIQEELGILGYERVKISKKEIERFLGDSIINDDGKSVILENITSIRGNGLHHNQVLDDKCIKVLSSLSEGEYPFECGIHTVGGYASNEVKEMYRNDIASDKFFIQKIYDIDTIKKNAERGSSPYEIMNHTPDNSNPQKSSITLFDKKTLETKEQIIIGKLSKEYDTFKDDHLFGITAGKGLNLAEGAFFASPISEEPSFGFSGNDIFLKNYAYKLSEIVYEQGKKENNLEYKKELFYSIADILTLIYYKDSKKYTLSENSDFIAHILDDFEKIIPKSELDLESSLVVGDSRSLVQIVIDMIRMREGPDGKPNGIVQTGTWHVDSPEFLLPIIINHDEIPQLSWGHAKYAHYFNDKGFNFFKFKHSDHLPTKEEINPSDS